MHCFGTLSAGAGANSGQPLPRNGLCRWNQCPEGCAFSPESLSDSRWTAGPGERPRGRDQFLEELPPAAETAFEPSKFSRRLFPWLDRWSSTQTMSAKVGRRRLDRRRLLVGLRQRCWCFSRSDRSMKHRRRRFRQQTWMQEKIWICGDFLTQQSMSVPCPSCASHMSMIL